MPAIAPAQAHASRCPLSNQPHASHCLPFMRLMLAIAPAQNLMLAIAPCQSSLMLATALHPPHASHCPLSN